MEILEERKEKLKNGITLTIERMVTYFNVKYPLDDNRTVVINGERESDGWAGYMVIRDRESRNLTEPLIFKEVEDRRIEELIRFIHGKINADTVLEEVKKIII